jgi:hypothetical protein
LPNGAGSFFWLHLPTTGDFAILPNGQQKKQQIFFRLTAFTGRWWAAGIQFWGLSVKAKLE